MNKPLQYLLVGFPYSGKTTLAKELVKELGFVHLNLDKLKWDLGYENVGDDDVPDEIWKKIFQKADKLLIKHLKAGKNVANEYAWITRAWRNKARKLASDNGFDTKIIYLNLPQEEIKKRWLTNSKTKNRFHWPKEELERMFTEFQEPTIDEKIIYYDSHLPLKNWVNKNLA